VGFLTRNRFRTEGSAAGYYPIVTMGQVRHVENMGGYSRLMAMEVADAELLINEGAQLHTEWVGAKPFYAQAAAKSGFFRAMGDAAYATEVGNQILEGTMHRQRRIRTSVNFRQRFCPTENTDLAWGDQVDDWYNGDGDDAGHGDDDHGDNDGDDNGDDDQGAAAQGGLLRKNNEEE
jgi:hypothetical protein